MSAFSDSFKEQLGKNVGNIAGELLGDVFGVDYNDFGDPLATTLPGANEQKAPIPQPTITNNPVPTKDTGSFELSSPAGMLVLVVLFVLLSK